MGGGGNISLYKAKSEPNGSGKMVRIIFAKSVEKKELGRFEICQMLNCQRRQIFVTKWQNLAQLWSHCLFAKSVSFTVVNV